MKQQYHEIKKPKKQYHEIPSQSNYYYQKDQLTWGQVIIDIACLSPKYYLE